MSAFPTAMYRRDGSVSSCVPVSVRFAHFAFAALCSLSTISTLCTNVVAAQPGGGNADDIERAVVLFETAEERYREGRFDVAVQLLLEARALHDDPTISYNLGRAYEELRELAQASEAYRHYLTVAPTARDRGAVEARIARLDEERVAQERRERGEHAEGDANPGDGGHGVDGSGGDGATHGASGRMGGVGDGDVGNDADRRDGRDARTSMSHGPSAASLLVVTAGVLGVGAGVAFGVLSNDARERSVDDPIHQSARASFRDAETFAIAANVAFIVGGLVAAAGLTWLVIDLVSSDESDAPDAPSPVSLVVGPSGVVLSGTWR